MVLRRLKKRKKKNEKEIEKPDRLVIETLDAGYYIRIFVERKETRRAIVAGDELIEFLKEFYEEEVIEDDSDND